MKSILVRRRTRCRLCDSARLKQVLSLAPTPAADKYIIEDDLDKTTPLFPLDLHMCLDCGHVQLLDVLNPRILFQDYLYLSGGTKSLLDHFDEVAQLTCDKGKILPGALVIDVGSNDGSLLRCFQRRGMSVLGIDPVSRIASLATAAGIPTLPEFLTPALALKINEERGAASVVCAFNVFAHADDLAGMADSIHNMLASDGLFVFEISYLLDVIDRMLLGTIFHEHMSYHSVKPMVPFLKRHGMELIDVRRNTIQGGSVVGTAQKTGGPHKPLPSVAELVKLEDERGLDRPETLRQFAARLNRLGKQIHGAMANLVKQGKSIWGYGAARSATTMISHMNLGNMIKCIVDDSPEKQNKYIPVHKIPIRPSSGLLQEKPDYVVIFAWIHADAIIRKNQEYLNQGGHFIVCFPEFRVVGGKEKQNA